MVGKRYPRRDSREQKERAMASDHETIFTMEATPVKFGTGASAEAGRELKGRS
jgi:hypothetical protein